MTDPDPDRKQKHETPDLPPDAGTEVPDAAPVADEEGRDPTEGPTSEQNRTAADTTKAEGEDEPPD
ncbi:hypothetical protein [Kitasatospora cineracea]|uniref:hypothetical protein n=1 Tax=Kitasatospora cineracea TaxID=88074 RepID=UPI0037AADA8B